MGGNLFGLGRLPRGAYLLLEAQVRTYLDVKLGGHYRIPRYYDNKESFGDLDVLVSTAALEDRSWAQLKAELVQDLGIQRHESKKRLFSTVYQDFQVDFFLISDEDFLSTYHFMSFNDLGNIVGRMVRRLGLKYGSDGLSYVFRRSDGSYRRDRVISRDPERIFAFLGLDPQRWLEGFADLEEIFAWAITSPCFSVTPYRDPGRTIRRRARQRHTMSRFVDWLDAHDVQQVFEPGDRGSLLSRIDAAFPEAGLLEWIAAEQQAEARALRLRARFSGTLVRAWIPELQGKELGRFIKAFRAAHSDEALLAMEPDGVRQAVLACWADQQGSGAGEI